MAVRVERYADTGMPQAFTHDLGVNTGRQHQRRVSVTKIVPPDMSDVRLREHPTPRPADRSRPGSVLSIRFFVSQPPGAPAQNSFGASGGGCNGFGPTTGEGQMPVTFGPDGTLHIPGDMSITAVGCPGRAWQDGWYLAFLKSSPLVSIDGSTVVMSSACAPGGNPCRDADTVITMIDGSPPPMP